MKKGEIYAPHWRLKDCTHYVVCMEDCDDNAPYFEACLITHMKTTKQHEIQNQAMTKDWFDEKNPRTKRRYMVQYDASQLICQPILKDSYKINLRKGIVGHLSTYGIKEAKKYTAEITPIYSNKPINKEHPYC